MLPCCWPDDQSRCACPRQHSDPKEVGKAPLTHHGVKDASDSRSTIETWWGQCPQANVAIALSPDYIMLDPDAPEALKEVYGLGVPETLTRISRNRAFLFAAPHDLGHVQITHKGESGAIDILNGYCLVFGRHRNGDSVFLENPIITPVPAPPWILEWVAKYRSVSLPPPDLEPDAPPVRLGPEDMKWWRGGKAVRGTGDGIDRSATLFSLGLILARANATVGTIIAALEDRDQVLGYAKYAERKDAMVRYADIAAKAVAAQHQRGRGEARHFRPLPSVRVTVRP